MRKISIFMILCMLIACMAGCGDTQSPAETAPPDSDYAKALAMMEEMPLHGNSVKSAPESYSILQNNITYEYIKAEGENLLEYSEYIEISGLKDKKVETAINNRIKEKYYELAESTELPNIVGKKLLEKEYAEKGAKYTNQVNAQVYYNANNILSVQVYKNLYVDKGERNPNGSYSDCYFTVDEINFDLATGEEINLGDCFTDGFDYVTYINQKLMEHGNKNGFDEDTYDEATGNYICVPSNFETIWPDMQFYPNSYGSNSITLIFDNSVKGFENLTSPQYFTIVTGENTAIAQRFAREESLFEDEAKNYTLIMRDLSTFVKDYYMEESEKPIADVLGLNASDNEETTYLKIKCPLTAPPNVLGRAKQEYENYDIFVNNAKNWFSSLKEREAFLGIDYDKVSKWGWYDINVNHIGRFFNLSVTKSINLYDYDLDYNRNYSESFYKAYDEKGNELSLSDIFKKDVNIKALITDQMYRNFEKNAYNELENYDSSMLWYAYEAYGEEYRELAEILYDNITGFEIDSTCLVFSYDDKEKLIADWIGDIAYEDGGERVNTIMNYLGYSLQYTDIGCENLTIF